MDPSSKLSSITLSKENVKNLLTKSEICGICLCVATDLNHWDSLINIASENKERLLKDIISGTFGIHIKALLPTKYLCEGCVTKIIQAYCLIRKIKINHSILEKCESVISRQLKSGTKLDQPKEKELLLMIDNIKSLNVPTTVTKSTVTQIIQCNVDKLREEENFDFENVLMKYECPYCSLQFPSYTQFKDHYSRHKDVYYRCKKCPKRFKLFKNLVKHRKKEHKELSICICDTCEIILLNSQSVEHENDHTLKKTCKICNVVFETKSARDEHTVKMHRQSYVPFLCEDCGESFTSQSFLDVHKRTHITVENLNKIITKEIINKEICKSSYEIKCTTCGQVLHSEEAYKNHKSKRNNKCKVCRKSYCTTERLIFHIQAKHPDFPTQTASTRTRTATNLTKMRYTCKECKEKFDCAEDYQEHNMEKHSKECPVCLKKVNKANFIRHLKTHNAEIDSLNINKPFACDNCEEKFISESALKKHSKQHKIVLKQCPHCDKSVSSVFYHKHLKTHVQEQEVRPLKSCTECNYKTRFAHCLDAHMNRFHLKIRPYKCEECDKTFYSADTMKSHKRTHSTGRPEFFCDICKNKFLSQKALTYHIRIHTGEKTYLCSYCGLSFITASRRQQHVIRKHFDPTFECDYCGKKLFTRTAVRIHINDVHLKIKRKRKYKKQLVIEEDSQSYELVDEEMIEESPEKYEPEEYQESDMIEENPEKYEPEEYQECVIIEETPEKYEQEEYQVY